VRIIAATGSVTVAVDVAGTSRPVSTNSGKAEPTFAKARQDAEEIAANRLEEEGRRPALEGVPEPLVSAGKLVRDDDGQPIMIRRYSDNLLLALIKAGRPPPRERSVRVQFPALRSTADATDAMAAISDAVASGAITSGEAAVLSRFVEASIKAIDAGGIVQRLLAIEAKLK
jgi:hypothetical protein